MAGKYERKDRLYRQAKEQGYRSRAAYKLLELDKKYRLLKKGSTVVDLGSFPGGWLQVAAERVGAAGTVVGIDLKDVEPVRGSGAAVTIIRGDLTEPEAAAAVAEAAGGKADVVLSDMSPQLSGIRFRDQARSAELVESAYAFCCSTLRRGGALVAKIFPGEECEEVVRALRTSFKAVSREVLDSTRKSSNELYLVAKGFRPSEDAEGKSDGDTAVPEDE